jgi:hypothetical protein
MEIRGNLAIQAGGFTLRSHMLQREGFAEAVVVGIRDARAHYDSSKSH